MATQNSLDDQFDDNLRRAAENIMLPSPPSAAALNRCVEELQAPVIRRNWFSSGRTVLISALSAAAVLALTTTVFFASRDGSPANAAMILARFEQQIQTGTLIDLVINSVHLDNTSIDGRLSIGEDTVAGDLRISVKDAPDEQPIEADFALGIAPKAKWILVRKLIFPEAQSIPMISALFPAGSETLVTLPNDEKDGISTGVLNSHGLLNAGSLISVLEQVVRENANEGTTIAEQSDGTVVLTLPLGNASVLASLRNSLGSGVNQLNIGVGAPPPSANDPKKPGLSLNVSFSQSSSNPAADLAGDEDEDDQDANDDEDDDADSDDLLEFANSTLALQYDPATDSVHSISITNIGPTKGSIQISIRDGQVDSELLDADRLVAPTTRRLDLSAFASMFKSFSGGPSDGK